MVKVTRYQDWQTRLIQYLSEVSALKFKPGVNDCALFLAGGVAAMTGHDYAALYRGRYTSVKGGLRILRKAGFDDHVALARACLPERLPSFARPGDGAAVEGPDGPALGIVQGASIYVLSPDGLSTVPLTRAICAFEV